jgi:hypothetical protein
MVRRGTTLAALVVLVGLLAGCGGGDTTSVEVTGAPISADELARAASASGDVESARFAFRLEAEGAAGFDRSIAISGGGALDGAGDRAALSMDLSAFAPVFGAFLGGLGASGDSRLADPGAWKIDAVQDGEVSYVRFPAFGDQLPEGKSWIRARDGSSVGGPVELGGLSGTGPKTFLELLEGVSGDVETVGTDTLHGVETTHYRATLDPASIEQSRSGTGQGDLRELADELFTAPELEEIPFDVWLDADGLIRQFRLDVTAAQPGGDTARASMSFELWDVGAPVEIELPPGDEVVDAESLELGG